MPPNTTGVERNEAAHRLAAQFRPSPRRRPEISNRAFATAGESHGPCAGQTGGPPVIVRGAGGLFTEDGGAAKPRSKRFGEPLAPFLLR